MPCAEAQKSCDKIHFYLITLANWLIYYKAVVSVFHCYSCFKRLIITVQGGEKKSSVHMNMIVFKYLKI